MPHSPQQIEDFNARLDHFAELFSLDIPIPDIRERMGLGRNTPYQLLARLEAKYGRQAL